MKIKDLHSSERPREKLMKLGASRLKNSELLAILIDTGLPGKSAVEIAEEVFSKNSLLDFWDFSLETLLKIPGINVAKACRLLAAKEFTQRINKQKTSKLQLTDPKLVVAFLSDLRRYKKEHLVALYLNINSEIIWQETISIGVLDETLVHPREVFEPAIRYLAAGIILAHNHPSDDANPSESDILVTKNLVAAGQILSIEILDHLIVTKDDFSSLKELQII